MVFPAVTSGYAAVLALMYAALSFWVIAGRVQLRVLFGDGGSDRLGRRVRAHGNFAEYVPLTLLLAALLEAGGAGHGTIHVLLLTLVVARVMHPIGLMAAAGSLHQKIFRCLGTVGTFVSLIAAAVLLLQRVA